ncbi:nitrate ABC transporter ATP-binding protein [Flammeovirga yaeyamensis]|uniref:Nitrate ABC transporter ATP-binding protein n=1 Tax=Flammeovirga yaeyamensis TaxID=367791 RepID=A0AAX1NC93_9BACT|nr:ABC transporter ATP-binding protein [Flammeovirga yaeyamensis]MBB3697875.1 nitrate/nitrite transport system ATP-binding protein [Flammeovirga yaeyamensis]NMF35770.1 ABC transporter ATP-binding protein [Flammeovirga yaeyamensis]QWG03278.1 nitrate ABC transporter ATP-binding protein [Flammeovirga yaeyamensis]
MAYLELRNVSKSFGTGKDRVEVLSNINLKVEEGEFLAIVGFTGSGKTTLINLINGLEFPDEGEVLLQGKPITGPGPDRGVVFQNYSLLPWLTVRQNVKLAVDEVFPDKSKTEKDALIVKYVEMVHLSHAIDKKPAELSGGMRQRVSVARALAMSPKMLLMDEPLSALDALTRGTLQEEIVNIWSEDKKTCLLITNDVDEGIVMADRIIPLNPGPKASLGPDFKVNLPRPRVIAEINKLEEYKHLRNEVLEYLIEVGASRKSEESSSYELPDLKPVMPGRIKWGIRKKKDKQKFF